MYTTRPISHYRSYPDALSLPPEGPNSGYLVIQDIEPDEIVGCFGLSKEQGNIHLPFPQNMDLTAEYDTGDGSSYNKLAFIPVLNQPLSRNLYYVIDSHKKHKGMAYACSKEEDMSPGCFCIISQARDVYPRPLDPDDTYQQFEIVDFENEGRFYAKSVAHNAIPPKLLRRETWTVQYKPRTNYILGEASGLNIALRARLPDLIFPLSPKSSKAFVIGKWYCPFMFIKDGTLTTSDQMANSIFYEMTLEQIWEQIFECDIVDHGNVVMVDAVVQREVVLVGGAEAVWDEHNVVDKTIWFTSFGSIAGEEVSVGLRLEVFKRMKWEEDRFGWVGGDERVVRVNRMEEFGGGVEGWKKFRCYVLVERFLLKRMDGSLVMTYDFKHTYQLQCLWD